MDDRVKKKTKQKTFLSVFEQLSICYAKPGFTTE